MYLFDVLSFEYIISPYIAGTIALNNTIIIDIKNNTLLIFIMNNEIMPNIITAIPQITPK